MCGRVQAFYWGGTGGGQGPGDQRYGSLGGIYSGSVQPERAGAQQVDGFLGMAPPDNGVNYCDIDFGFIDDLPAGSSLLVPPDFGVPGGCPASSLVTLRGAPSVPDLFNGVNYGDIDFGVSGELPSGSSLVSESGRMDSFGWNESLGNQGTFSEVRGRVWNNSSGTGMDSVDWNEPSGNQWTFPDESRRDLHADGREGDERFIRPGRINYRERTFYGRHGHNG
ncbi:MAG: hypothetical protein GY696_37785 [Gammaproteobacteria bacterium]|nr:hypothetical protein [Gammaproteobacteria bacterium]